jgi:PAS domain S-box-containing protein
VSFAVSRRRAEAELERERQLLRAVVRQMPQAVAVAWAPSGELLLANDQMLALGATRALHPDGRPLAPAEWPLARSVATGELVRGEELRVVREDGGESVIRVSSGPVRDAGGAVVAGVCTIDDISDERRRQAELRLITETIPQLVWTALPDGSIDYWNQHWIAYTGLGLAETRAHGWADALHPDDRARTLAAWAASVAAGTPYDMAYRLRRHRDGAYRWFIGRALPLRDSQGQIVRWFGTSTDIHEERENDRAMKIHGRVLQSMAEGVRVSDEHGIIVFTNAAEDRMFGYAPGELVGQHVSIQDGGEAPQRQRVLEEIQAHLRTHDSWSAEWDNVRKDGSRFTSRARITALDVDGRPYWVCVQEDITAEKRAASERERQREAVEAADRRKDEFLALLGHELRNPLAPILTALQLMSLRGAGGERERAVIERQVVHMVQLVDDLLDISRIMRGKIELKREHVELSSVLARAIEMASPLYEQRGHHLTLHIPRTGLAVHADPMRLAQVFANLLTNAAKYTDPGGHVELRAGRDGERVCVRVRDDGIGIAGEVIARIFDPFVQAERRTDRAQGGLGLGLPLVRSLLALHGGVVGVRSEGVGRGSEFIVHLPALAEGDATVSAATSPAPGLPIELTVASGRRVLVVDDNEDAAEMLGETLRVHGHDVRVALDGVRALALTDDFSAEIAILDIGLPVMDGFELARRLRERWPQATLVALTGYGQERDRQRSLTAGFAVHLVKPVSTRTILELIDDLDDAAEDDGSGALS